MLVTSAGMTISAAASPGDMIRLENADRDGRQALAEHAFDEAGEHEGNARHGENGDRVRHAAAYSASPRISRGCDAARRDALAHHGAAQRADPVDQVEAEAARALHRQEIGQQRAVEQVDRERAARHVGAPQRVVAREQIVGADVAAVAARRHHELADGGGVAQAEIEALRADRRNEMRGLADQRDAVDARSGARSRPRAETRRGPVRPRPCPGSNASAARSRRSSAASSSAAIRSASAGSTTQTRLDRSPGSGTSVNGPLSVWNSVEVSWCGRAWRRLKVSAVCG